MLSRRTFLSIALMFLMILVMFLSVGVSSDRLAGSYTNPRADAAPAAGPALLADAFDEANGADGYAKNPRAAIISAPGDAARVLAEWCQLNKYRYRAFDAPPSAEEIEGYDAVLFGDVDLRGAAGLLAAYAQAGAPLVFSQMPDYAALAADAALADFLGIERCVAPAFAIDGIKIFADFFLGGERIYAAGDDYGTGENFAQSVPYYTLRAGYKVYSVALLREQGEISNERLPPLIWRTRSGNAFVFVANTDLFAGEATLGLVTAFLSDAQPRFLYPVVNAQTIAVVDFPLFSGENADAISARYSRETAALTRDILWPNVVKVLENYGGGMNLFLTPTLDRTRADAASADEVRLYFKGINKASGIAALSLNDRSGAPLSEVLAAARAFFAEAVPDYRFTALYTGPYDAQEVAGVDDISLALSPYREGKPLYALNGEMLSVLATQQGFSHGYAEDAALLAFQTALVASTQLVDMSRAYYPAGDQDDWSRLSQIWSAGITYYRDFAAFDRTDIYAMEDRVRGFLAMNVVYEDKKNKIDVTIECYNGGAWFVLRLWNEVVEGVENGSAARLSDSAWLICADGPEVSIHLREIDRLS